MATNSHHIDPATIQRRLECPVCHETYRRPRILPCSHTLCQRPCLEQIINGKAHFSCPECRSEHAVPDSGPSGFLMNVAIARVTEDSSESLRSLPGCPICGEDVLLVKCCHCEMNICEECKIEHIPKFRKQLGEALEEFQEEINLKRSACASLEKTLKEEVKGTTDLAFADIKKASEDLIETIGQKVKMLRQKVQKFVEDEYENINYQTEESLRHLNKAAEFCEAELKELNSNRRLTHIRLSKIQNGYRENNAVVSKRRRVMSVRRLINVRRKPVIAVVEDFCDVEILQDNLSEKDVLTADEENVLDEIGSLLEQKFTTPKLSIGSVGEDKENLSVPCKVAVDPDNKDIFVSDKKNHRIQVFDRNGEHKLSFGSFGHGDDHFKLPVGITISKKGHVIVADQCNNRVKVHARDGSFIRAFGQKGSAPGMFDHSYGLAQDPGENIHVCDVENKRVQIFNESGKFLGKYNSWKPLFDQEERPMDISITASGQIGVKLDRYIVILNDKQQLLHHFALKCSTKTLWGEICYLDDDHLFLSDRHKHKICLYTSKGSLIREMGVPGFYVGQLQKPRGITIDGAHVYVVCEGSGMVQKF